MDARRLLTGAAVLGLAAAGLGLVGTPTASASCAGPRLSVSQSGVLVTPLPRNPDEEAVYPIATDRRLGVTASNLADGCQDTYSTTGPGCGSPQPTVAEPLRPLSELRLVLRQGGHRWTLDRAEAPAADLTATFAVPLPAGARPGAALLELTSQHEVRGSLRLQLG